MTRSGRRAVFWPWLAAAALAGWLAGCGSSGAGGGSTDGGGADVTAGGDALSDPAGADLGAPDGSGSEADAAADDTVDEGDGVDEVAAAITWSGEVSGFFQTYCVSCHHTSPKDFRTYGDVSAWSATIRCGVAPSRQPGCGASPAPRQFPIGNGPFPSDDERQAVVDWIDAAMPE